MFGLTRWSPFEDMFNFQREVDRLFNQFWSDLPARATAAPGSFQVKSDDDGWRVEVPMPGIDPQRVTLEVAGNTVSIRANAPDRDRKGSKGQDEQETEFEQALTLPQFLDLEKLTASHRHGMLELKVPLKESVRPRRVQIEMAGEERKQLTGAGV